MGRGTNRVENHLPLPQAALNILLALLEGDAHGHAIKKSIEERSRVRMRMRAGTLYEAPYRLDRGGLIGRLGTIRAKRQRAQRAQS